MLALKLNHVSKRATQQKAAAVVVSMFPEPPAQFQEDSQ